MDYFKPPFRRPASLTTALSIDGGCSLGKVVASSGDSQLDNAALDAARAKPFDELPVDLIESLLVRCTFYYLARPSSFPTKRLLAATRRY